MDGGDGHEEESGEEDGELDYGVPFDGRCCRWCGAPLRLLRTLG